MRIIKSYKIRKLFKIRVEYFFFQLHILSGGNLFPALNWNMKKYFYNLTLFYANIRKYLDYFLIRFDIAFKDNLRGFLFFFCWRWRLYNVFSNNRNSHMGKCLTIFAYILITSIFIPKKWIHNLMKFHFVLNLKTFRLINI